MQLTNRHAFLVCSDLGALVHVILLVTSQYFSVFRMFFCDLTNVVPG